MKLIIKFTPSHHYSAAFRWCLLAPALVLSPFAIQAEHEGFTVGVGLNYIDKPYRDYDSSDKRNFLPILNFEGEHFFLRNGTIGWDFSNDDLWEFAIIGEYMRDQYDSSDSDFLSGMDDRDASIGVGAQIGYRMSDVGMRFTALRDVADNSDGTQLRAIVDYSLHAGDFTFVPFGGLVWQNDDYNDYYYGVDGDEATGSRTAYQADDDINYRIGLTTNYRYGGNSPWVFTGGVEYEWLGDEIDDSSITNEDKQFSAFFGVGYTFR